MMKYSFGKIEIINRDKQVIFSNITNLILDVDVDYALIQFFNYRIDTDFFDSLLEQKYTIALTSIKNENHFYDLYNCKIISFTENQIKFSYSGDKFA